jgi:hypothetical protein
LYLSLENSTTGIAIAHLNLHGRIRVLEIQIFIAKLKVYRMIKKVLLTHNIPHILLTNQILVSDVIARYMFVNQSWLVIFQMAAFQIDSNIVRNIESNTKDFGFVNKFQSSILSQIMFAVIIFNYIDHFCSSFSIKGLSFIKNTLFRAKSPSCNWKAIKTRPKRLLVLSDTRRLVFGQNRLNSNFKMISDLKKIRRKKYLTTIRLNIKFRFRYIIIHRSSTPTKSLYCCFKFAFLCNNWFIIGFELNSEFLINIVGTYVIH